MSQTYRIVSGSFSYCCKRVRDLSKEGYALVDQKKWADGKYSFKFLPKDIASKKSG